MVNTAKYSAARIFCWLTFATVAMTFCNTLLGLIGVPKLLAPVREVVVLVLFAIAFKRSDIFKDRYFFVVVLIYLFLLVSNIIIAALESKHFAGLYYSRIYLMSAVVAVTVHGLLLRIPEEELPGMVRLVFRSGLVIIFTAFLVFIWLEIDPPMLFTLMGQTGNDGKDISAAWRIAGGGAWLRLGLPAISPNALALMVVFYMLFMVPVLMEKRYIHFGMGAKITLFSAALISLVMTFSRSSWIALALGIGIVFFVCRHEWKIANARSAFKIFATLMLIFFMMVVIVIVADIYSGGYIGRWIDLTQSGSDPSMVGHGQTFVDAIDHIQEYFWLGYPKGTVGARAIFFGNEMYNAENSFIVIFYEMGVPLGVLFWILVAAMLRGLWIHKIQWGFLAAFMVSNMLLPYVFEPDVIALFLMLSVLMGRVMQCADRARAGLSVPWSKASRPIPYRGRHPGTSAFQPTIFDPR
jgi:O-Antigen ligase